MRLAKIFAVMFFLCAPAVSRAAVLSIEPVTANYAQNETFVANVAIKLAPKECINAVSAAISFPRDLLSLRDFSDGGSVISLWVTKPVAANFARINYYGMVQMQGGIPGGLCGEATSTKNSILGKLIFKVNKLDSQANSIASLVFLESTAVLLNDGLGTEAKIAKEGATYNLSIKKEPSNLSWNDQLKKDKTPPEPFIVNTASNPAMFNGMNFLVFSTIDKQSGIDHYEVYESEFDASKISGKDLASKIKSLLKGGDDDASWVEAVSPFQLRDQSLQSLIRVKAVDKAGNERIVGHLPGHSDADFNASGFKDYIQGAPAANSALFALLTVILIMQIALLLTRPRGTKKR